MAIRVLVADDNTLIRKQIRTIVESDMELEVCAEAVNNRSRRESSGILPRHGGYRFSDAGDGRF